MKNKIFSIISVAAICVAIMSSQAFAADVRSDISIYAADAKEIAIRAEEAIPDDIDINIKADTVMPVYLASIYDYAENGKFTFTPDTTYGAQAYFADYVNSKGNFAGSVLFVADGSEPGVIIEAPRDDEAFAVDFRANADRIGKFMKKKNLNIDIVEAKFAQVEGLGYVYYISNGTEELFVSAHFKGTNGDYFTKENDGIIIVDDDFRTKAAMELAERNAQTITDNKNPTTGGNTPPAYITDKEPLTGGAASDNNPLTGGAGSVAAGVITLAACGIGLMASNRKKN